MEKVRVGLIGFGTVGTGVVRVLQDNREVIGERVGVEIELKAIADRDLTRDRGVSVEGIRLTTDAWELIRDPEISIIIELIGGYEPARTFILGAIEEGKHVVTANKALLSTYGREIFERAKERMVDVAFEASVGGGIPVIKAIKEGLVANRIRSIYGIINGTAKYILTRMTNEGEEYEKVLKMAQEKGYAEADPTFDVEGIDTAHKLAILVSIAFGHPITAEEIYTEGITEITPLDIEFAREFGYKIKLLAIAKEEDGLLEARVHPTMIPVGHPLASVDGVFNAIFIEGDAVGPVMLFGKGAGMMPTASAVVADVVDLVRNIRNGVRGRVPPLSYMEERKGIGLKGIGDVELPHYLRFTVVDRPGVLSKISGVLGRYEISIASVIQKGRRVGEPVPVVITTHHAPTEALKNALEEIDRLDVVLDRTVSIRIEDSLGGSM